jgi:hypothetical protein
MTTACQGAEAVIHLGGIATEAPWRRIPWSSSRPRARVGGGALNQGYSSSLAFRLLLHLEGACHHRLTGTRTYQ